MADERRQRFRPGDGPVGAEPALDPEGRSPEAVGRLLRRARERAGLRLEDLSATLRIRLDYLEAIERSDFDRLPGATYAAGFVRSYANYLDLDTEDVLRRFKDEAAGMNRGQALHFPEPVNEGKVPGGAILLISLVLAAAAYGGWYLLSGQGQSVSDFVPEVPERLQELVGAPAPDSGAAGADRDAPPEPQGDAEAPAASDFAGGDPAAIPDPEAPSAASDPPDQEVPVPAPSPEETSTAAAPQAAGEAAPQPPESQVAPSVGAEVAQTPETAEADATAPSAPAGDSAPETARVADTPDPAETPAPESPALDTTVDAIPAPPSPESGTGDSTAAVSDGPAPEATAAAAPAPPLETAEAGDAATGNAGANRAGTAPGTAADAAGGRGDVPLAEAERVFGAETAEARVVLRAVADSWVRVRDADGTLLLTRVLRPGEVYRAPNRAGVVLDTGNAGGLQVVLDGQPLRRLGEPGEVRRNIVLEPEALRR